MIRRILPTFGVTLITFGMTFMLPLAISIIGDDGAGHAFWPALLIAAFLGLILVSPAIIAREMPSLMPRDGMLLVALCWTLLPALAALPLIDYFQAAGKPISWSFAYFEAVSGLTTTGATVITGLDDLPYAINFWRCFLQWIGGMGILILAVAILPLVSAGAGSIFKAESTGPLKEAKLDLLPRTGHIRLRKSGWVEIHKIAWQTALAGHHPATNAVENDYSPVSRFRSFLGRLEAT